MVFESIAGGLVKAALPKVAGTIAATVKNKLHPGELQRSLEVGLRESGAFDRGQKVNNVVFYHCTNKDADTFLAALLEHPEVQRELQKPLEQDGAPDVAMLVQVAKHIAADRSLAIQDETLEPWLKAFANAYFEAITAIRFQVAKADYLEQLANWFDDVKFAGVAVPGQDVERAERLAQIFVMPDVEEDGRRGRVDGWMGEGVDEWMGGRDGAISDDRQFQLLQEQRLRAQLERSGRKFSARQLLNQHQKKVVLLGAPGSGKTTLMSFFAVTLAEGQGAGEAGEAGGAGRQGAIALANDAHAKGSDRDAEGNDRDRAQIDSHTEGNDRNATQIDRLTQGLDRDRSQLQRDRSQMVLDTEGLRLDPLALQTDTDALPLPILIRIRDWARTPDVTLPEYARQFAETTMSCKPLPKGFFEHWLNNGRSLILLDGLDEVAEEAKRYHLVQCIENFLGQYPQNRAIITSRPAGYKRDFFRTEEFPHYELQPFDDGKIEEFCDRWYRSRVPDTAEALRRKESLQKALNQQDRIKLLARNPLLLTIIALIHRYQARLPRERYKLYDKAVETLLTAWDDNKELSNQTVLKYLQLDDLRRLMESLAYWIHTQGTTGDREGGTLIDKDKLIQKLCQEIKTLKQLQHYEAKAEADRFVKFIRDRTGLLNEQGQDCYAFVHKTFQEYLAAQDINYQADNEDDFEIVLTHIEQHLHDPHWREVLLLLIAQQSPKKAARAIRKVLTANSPYEQWLHRDVLFAGRGLAEDPKGLNGADSQLSSEILTRLVHLEKNEPSQIGEKICSQIFQVLSSLSETTFEHEALELLKNQSNEIEQVRFQEYRAALGEKEEAIVTLLFFLEGNNLGAHILIEDDVRSRAAEALVNLGTSLDTLINLLPRLLKSGRSGFKFIKTLGKLSKTSEWVLKMLLPLLESENNLIRSSTPYALSYALCNFHDLSDSVVPRLLLQLEDQNAVVRGSVAEALGNLPNVEGNVVAALLRCLEDEESFVRSEAAYTLSRLGSTDERVMSAFLSHLENKSSDSRWKSRSARALSRAGQNSDKVLSALLLNLNHKDPLVCVSAALALCDLWRPDERSVNVLFSCLDDESSSVRSIAVEALSKLGKTNVWILPLLVQWIEQHQDEECVGAGIDALWAIVEGEG